jgi:hypothetical protein
MLTIDTLLDWRRFRAGDAVTIVMPAEVPDDLSGVWPVLPPNEALSNAGYGYAVIESVVVVDNAALVVIRQTEEGL